MGAQQHPMHHDPIQPEVAARLAALDALGEGAARETAILAALEDESPAVRERAIRLATRYIEPQVLGGLVADEMNATRRNSAITALERQGPYALFHLEGMLRQYQVDVVMFALQTLARIGDPSVAPSVLPFVRHPDLNVAQSAIEALGRLRSVEAVPVLIQHLEGKLWLQLAAIDALGEIGDARAVEPLLDLVSDSVVAESALKALQRIAAPSSLELLLTSLPLVREPLLRDALLLAIGAVINRHPDPASVAIQHCAELELDPARDVLGYLETILSRQVAGDAGEPGSLIASAASLAAAAGLRSIYPLMLSRMATGATSWAEGLFRRHPAGLSLALPELLQHGDPLVRRGALLAGTFTMEDVSRILSHLEAPDELTRAAACRALGRVGATHAVPLLIARLRDGGPDERAAAIDALGRIPAESLSELEPCLRAGAPQQVLLGALEILSKQKSPSFEARIMELTCEHSIPVRRAALRAAAKLPGARADVALLRALADREQMVQVEALDLLVSRGGTQATAVLTALLGTDDSLRYYVIRALGRLKAVEAAGRLEILYLECGPRERLEILLALIRISPPDLARFLHARLDELDVDARRLAAHGLAGLGDTAQLPRLRALAEDADWNIRNEAASGFGLLAEPESRDVLLCLVRDVEPVVAHTARAALDRLGASGPLMVA